MRLWRLTASDVRFQWKYGFYFVYAVFCTLYLLSILTLPQPVRQTVAVVMVFTDPAAMGLFFMGAIVLLEKSQRVNCALAVSPIRIWEYIAAKVFSLSAIGLAVGLVLAVAGGIQNLVLCALGILLASLLFSLCGMIVAIKVTTLNQFLLYTIPFELVICLPPALLFFGFRHPAMAVLPGVAAVYLISGDTSVWLVSVVSLCAWTALAYFVCCKAVHRNFTVMGGADV